jgi:cobalamin biosynthesis Mg chelatase CobN
VIEPKEKVRLVVILRTFDHSQTTDQVKDKFMVQSMFCNDGDTWNESLFKEASPDQLMDSKLRCVFDYPAQQKNSGPTNEADAPNAALKDADRQKIQTESNPSVEISRLREENSRLLRENLDLQEDAAKLRKRVNAGESIATSGGPSAYATKQSADQSATNQNGINLTMEILAVAFLVTFFLALFIGKVVL